jgi:uncharacterized protein YndB with AHSA1/START domain
MNYTIELEVDKPRDEVAKLFTDSASLPFWQPGFVSLEHLSGDEGKPGAKSRLMYKNRGQDVELVETIEVNDPPEEFTATFDAKGMHIWVKNTFHEIDGGKRTRWVSENEGKTSGLMMKIIGILMPGCFKKESMKYNVAFKAFAETGADIRESS